MEHRLVLGDGILVIFDSNTLHAGTTRSSGVNDTRIFIYLKEGLTRLESSPEPEGNNIDGVNVRWCQPDNCSHKKCTNKHYGYVLDYSKINIDDFEDGAILGGDLKEYRWVVAMRIYNTRNTAELKNILESVGEPIRNDGFVPGSSISLGGSKNRMKKCDYA